MSASATRAALAAIRACAETVPNGTPCRTASPSLDEAAKVPAGAEDAATGVAWLELELPLPELPEPELPELLDGASS